MNLWSHVKFKWLCLFLFSIFLLSCDHSPKKKIKIGILHSLSGTMGDPETTLINLLRMEIDIINRSGGILGYQLEPVIENPNSDWNLYAEKAKKLLIIDKVAVIFGCWTSSSRKAVQPIIEKYNSLLFYPIQYEGNEQSKNIFYLGAAPNQQALPAIEYLTSPEGGHIKNWFFLGTDYIYPRVTNAILIQFLKDKGVPDEAIKEVYVPFEFENFTSIIRDIKPALKEGATAIISTLNGGSNFYFYRALGREHLEAEPLKVMAFSVSEEEFRGYHTYNLPSVLTAWNYFMSLKNPVNKAWVKQWKAYTRAHHLQGEDQPLTNDPMEATHTGIWMWKAAVEKAGTFEVNAVRKAMIGQKLLTPSGYIETMEANHHLSKPAMIGELQKNRQFKVIWKSQKVIPSAPWLGAQSVNSLTESVNTGEYVGNGAQKSMNNG